jgi:hypothetical protein
METPEIDTPRTSMLTSFMDWLKYDAANGVLSFLISLVVNVSILISFMFVGDIVVERVKSDAPSFEAEIETELPEPDLTRFEVGETPIEPSILDTESLTITETPQIEQGETVDMGGGFVEEGGGIEADSNAPALGGLGGFDIAGVGPGPAMKGLGGVGVGVGTGRNPGMGGSGMGFEGRGEGARKAMVGTFGGTRNTERTVAAALSWIANHQNPDGSWSLNYQHRCKDPTCVGVGETKSDSAATAMALLPFFAAGQTHKSKGPYQKPIYGGLQWLIKNQRPDGNLAAGSNQVMYSHGLAAIAMCEAYGLTKDPAVGRAATGALNFIVSGQDPATGGWWYQHKQRGGDTSVYGWQLMALKSGDMAGLPVSPSAFEGSKVWLKGVAKGKQGGLFSYRPDSGASPTMTAVGLLCSQYLGMKADDPAMKEGVQYLMARLPDEKSSGRNCYYTYYATQVMHNIPGPDWDKWNRQMRRGFIETQAKEGCAMGSWNPLEPKDPWSKEGGRLMLTSLATLSLEVYYRYLPLYQIHKRADEDFAL